MAEVRQTTTDSTKADDHLSPLAQRVVTDKMLAAVFGDLGKIGLGPQSVIKTDYLPPLMVDLDPPVRLDPFKLPTFVPDLSLDDPNHLILPFKLGPPAFTYKGDGYTVAISPTADPLKPAGGILVSGTFSNP